MTSTETASPHVFDTDEARFDQDVIERSHHQPVIVDLWAEWCAPCRTLGPMLESAVDARGGDVALAKVDVDSNPDLARRYRVQGIPMVLAFRDGNMIQQFTGVRPAAELERFIDDLVPSEADQAVARARTLDATSATAELRRALELEPDHREAAIGLAELLVQDDPDEADRLVRPHRPDPAAEAVATRAELARSGTDLDELQAKVDRGAADGATLLDLGRALAADGQHDAAIERLLEAVQLGGDSREPARQQLVALFGLLGDDHPAVRDARPRLARALY